MNWTAFFTTLLAEVAAAEAKQPGITGVIVAATSAAVSAGVSAAVPAPAPAPTAAS